MLGVHPLKKAWLLSYIYNKASNEAKTKKKRKKVVEIALNQIITIAKSMGATYIEIGTRWEEKTQWNFLQK